MERMYRKYKDIAEFYIVYITEAHAEDDSWPVEYAKRLGIKEHSQYSERCSVAERLVKEGKLTIPCLVDGMDNTVGSTYHASPDRVFVVRSDGRLAVAGRRGPWGFKPGLEAADRWLSAYRATGVEPELGAYAADQPTRGELEMKLAQATAAGEYQRAVSSAQKLHEMAPQNGGVMYTLASAHAASGDSDAALDWLERAVEAGYDDDERMLEDEALTTIRNTPEFQRLVQRVRERRVAAASTLSQADLARLTGDWEMEISFDGRPVEVALMSVSAEGGTLDGSWSSHGRDMPLRQLKFDGNALSFVLRMAASTELAFEGAVVGDSIMGSYTSSVGKMAVTGRRASQ